MAFLDEILVIPKVDAIWKYVSWVTDEPFDSLS